MMEFETWNRETIINEIKAAMPVAYSLAMGNFMGLPMKPKLYSDKELQQKTDYELRCVYVDLKQHDKKFRDEYQKNEEKKRFFNRPECNADYNYWSKQAYWSIDEAIALALGKEPRKVTWDNVKGHLPISSLANKFNETREMARRYVCCKELFDPVLPGIFLAWAKRMNIKIPKELTNAVRAAGIQVADWKGHYETMASQYSQLKEQYTQALECIKKNEEIIEELENQVTDHEPAYQYSQPDDLKETERQSLYKLLSAMAYDGYGYDPEEKKSPLPKEISDAVTERLGEKIDPDTARKWLKKSTEQYPDKIQSKTEQVS